MRVRTILLHADEGVGAPSYGGNKLPGIQFQGESKLLAFRERLDG